MKKFCTPWYFAIVGGYVIENHLYTMVHFAFLPNLHVKRPFGLFVNVRCLKTISFITPRHFQTHAFLPTHFHLHSFQVWAFMLFIEEKGFHKDYCGWRVSVTKSCILCWNFILSNKACPNIFWEKNGTNSTWATLDPEMSGQCLEYHAGLSYHLMRALIIGHFEAN